MEKNIVMPHPSNTLIVAAPGAGKTCLICNLISNPLFYGHSFELMEEEEKSKGTKPYFDAIFLFLNSADDAYDPLIRKKLILPNHVSVNPSLGVIQNVLTYQKNLITTTFKGDISKAPKVLCIYDDCVSAKKMLMSEAFLTIFTQSRHNNISNIVTTQYLNLIPKSIRMVCDFIICFKLNKGDTDLLADAYTPATMSKEKFKGIVYDNTKDQNGNKNNFFVISRKETNLNKKFRQNFDNYITVEHLQSDKPRFNKRSQNEYMKCDTEEEKYEPPIELKDFTPEIEKVNGKAFNVTKRKPLHVNDNSGKVELNLPGINSKGLINKQSKQYFAGYGFKPTLF